MLECYYMDLNHNCSEGQLLELYKALLPDRRTVVDRLNNEDMKKKQILTGGFLQYVLCSYLNVSVKDIELCYNSHGKPSVRMSDIHFNMSHSGKYVMIALCDNPVGLDIEIKRSDRIGVAKRCFCKEEYEDIISGRDEKEIEDRFLEYWTLKEAYVKYLGIGISVPFNSFRIIRDISEYHIVDYCDDNNSGSYEKKKDLMLKSFRFDTEYRYSICHKRECIDDCSDVCIEDYNAKKVDISELF